jgi:tetratricopeptide (TPR) repeat protein
MKEYQAAQKLFEELVALDSSRTDALPQLAVTHNNLALLLAGGGKVDEAKNQYARAIGIQRQLVASNSADRTFASQLAESQANLGMLLDQMGDGRAAEQALAAAVTVLRQTAETSSAAEPKHAHHLAIVLNNLSYVLRKRDTQAAEGAVREAIARLEPIVRQHPHRIQFQDDLALCFNNLASLLGRDPDQLTEAIGWHEKAIALQERLARKSPAVVRHRSDLAISLNNLGVAHCRADQADAADSAFERARTLFSTLAADYPDNVAYQSSLAALLNNQALALTDADRHEQALAIYPTAIESQRVCWQERPESPLMREVLSKMYYNFGQSLRRAGRMNEAAQAAIARRDVWRDDGERLLGVAVELAQIETTMETGADGTTTQPKPGKWDNEVVATLRLAHKSGWPADYDLATDERFVHLRNNRSFAALIAELSAN